MKTLELKIGHKKVAINQKSPTTPPYRLSAELSIVNTWNDEENQIIIRPVKIPREGWDAAFKIMGGKGDDEAVVVDENISHSWDEEEWHWQ